MTIYSTTTNICYDCIRKSMDDGSSYRQRYVIGRSSKKLPKGKSYDSKFEGSFSAELERRKQAGEILDYDTQYRVDMWVFRSDGQKAFMVRHKVDFRVHKLDGSYKLIETKGIETSDYQFRRNILVNIWLPDNLDYEYEVVRQAKLR